MNKKGSLLDTLPIFVGILMFGAAMLFILYVMAAVKPAFHDPNIPAFGTTIFDTGNDQLPSIFDNLGAMLIIGLPLIAASLAYMLQTSAVFFWLIVGFSSVFVVAGGAISYLWEQIAGVGAPLASQAAQLPIISLVLSNFAVYALFIVMLLLGSIYMRVRTQGGFNSGL